MRLFIGLIWKDIRALKWALLVWVVLLSGQFVLVTREWPDTWRSQYSVIRLLLALWPALIIQQDSLVGDSAFWRTRPIPKPTLLAAKASLIALLTVLMPMIAQLSALSIQGLESERLPLAALSALVDILGIVAPMTALAALTRNLPTFVLCALAATAASLGYVVPFVIQMTHDPSVTLDEFSWRQISNSMSLTGGLTCLVLGVAIVVHQCYRRRIAVSAGMFVAGIFLLATAKVVTPGDLWTNLHENLVGAQFDEGDFQWNIDKRRRPLPGHFPPPPLPPDQALGVLGTLTYHLPPARLVSIGKIESRFTTPDDSLKQTSFAIAAPEGKPPEALRHLTFLPNGIRSCAVSDLELLVLKGKQIERFWDKPGRLEVEVEYSLGRDTVIGRMPMRKGASLRHGANLYEIEGIEPVPFGEFGRVWIDVQVRTKSVRLELEERSTRRRWTAVEKNRSEALEGLRSKGESGRDVGLFVEGAQLHVENESVRFSALFGPKTDDPEAWPDEWFANAELLLIERTLGGPLKRKLRFEDVRLRDFPLKKVPTDGSRECKTPEWMRTR